MEESFAGDEEEVRVLIGRVLDGCMDVWMDGWMDVGVT